VGTCGCIIYVNERGKLKILLSEFNLSLFFRMAGLTIILGHLLLLSLPNFDKLSNLANPNGSNLDFASAYSMESTPNKIINKMVASDKPASVGLAIEGLLKQSNNVLPKDLSGVLTAIGDAVVNIGEALRDGNSGFAAKKTETQNTFGDEQLEVRNLYW
jgi:hypothetical protein